MKNSDAKNCNLQQEVKSKIVLSSSSKPFIISMGTEAQRNESITLDYAIKLWRAKS